MKTLRKSIRVFCLSLSVIALATTISFAQCEKKVRFSSSKTDHVDSKGNLLRTEQESAVVQISKSEVAIVVDGESKGIFNVTSMSCDWKVPFKEGKTSIKASRDGMNVSLILEGKGGKVIAYFIPEGLEDDSIRVTTDKFEEDI